MNREQLIRALRRYARKRGLLFVIETARGKGSHYRVKLDGKTTTIQDNLDPGRIERVLKQLGIVSADL